MLLSFSWPRPVPKQQQPTKTVDITLDCVKLDEQNTVIDCIPYGCVDMERVYLTREYRWAVEQQTVVETNHFLCWPKPNADH